MTGTDELHTPDSASKLAVLIERHKALAETLEGNRRIMEGIATSVAQLVASVHQMDSARLVDREQWTSRSEANRTSIDVLRLKLEEETRQRISVDLQPVMLIQQERADRESHVLERKAAHDRDMNEIHSDIVGIKKTLTESVFWNRILSGVAAVAAVISAGLVIAEFEHIIK